MALARPIEDVQLTERNTPEALANVFPNSAVDDRYCIALQATCTYLVDRSRRGGGPFAIVGYSYIDCRGSCDFKVSAVRCTAPKLRDAPVHVGASHKGAYVSISNSR